MGWQFSKRGRERLAAFATLVAAVVAISTDTNAAGNIATVVNAGHADFGAGTEVVASPLTVTTVVESVYPGNMQRIYRQVSYNGATCKEITPGTWTINQAPLHGTASVGTVDLPLTGGLCPGVIFTWAAIFYKWTSTNPTDLTDVVAATWTNAVPQSFSYIFDWT